MTLDAHSIKTIANAFTNARSNGETVVDYPGPIPSSLNEAYAIQDAAIALTSEKVAGWKVGGIDSETAKSVGAAKLVGPIFEDKIVKDIGKLHKMDVFEHGFAAVEGEVVLTVLEDAPKDKTSWTLNEARSLIGAAHMGVEIASSPFAKINDLGPMVTISDFGNNYGLIIGEMIPDWEQFVTKDWIYETFIDGSSVGKNSSRDAGGPLESFRFCLENTARRGFPLRKGTKVTTGAITGVHQAFVGQTSIVRCKGTRDINLELFAK